MLPHVVLEFEETGPGKFLKVNRNVSSRFADVENKFALCCKKNGPRFPSLV